MSVREWCYCSAIPSSLTVKRKCPHHGECDIDAERADEASGSQQFDGGPYDLRAGSDFDGSERAPHQAYSGGLQKGRRSRTRSRQPRSQTSQRYTGPVGVRRGASGADPIRGLLSNRQNRSEVVQYVPLDQTQNQSSWVITFGDRFKILSPLRKPALSKLIWRAIEGHRQSSFSGAVAPPGWPL